MKNIIRVAVLFFGLMSFTACKKQSQNPPAASTSSVFFLSLENDYIDGKINSYTYTWRLTTADQYVKINAFSKDEKQSQSFGFYTTLCDARVEVFTPYHTTTDELFNNILTIGKKQIGGNDNQFQIRVTLPVGLSQFYNAVGTYTSDGVQDNKYLEILKAENKIDPVTQKQYKKVWLKFGGTLYAESRNDSIQYTKGVLIARFLSWAP